MISRIVRSRRSPTSAGVSQLEFSVSLGWSQSQVVRVNRDKRDTVYHTDDARHGSPGG